MIDFISKLLEDNGHTMVMIFIGYFGKIVQLVPLQESNTQLWLINFQVEWSISTGYPSELQVTMTPNFVVTSGMS